MNKLRFLRDDVAAKLPPYDIAELTVLASSQHRLVHKCGGGVECLARRLGYASGQVLINETVVHGASVAKHGLWDAALIWRETQDFTVYDKIGEFIGRNDCHPIGCGADVIAKGVEANAEMAEALRASLEACADGHISDAELMRIEKEADDVIRKARELQVAARQMHANGQR